ncbi:MAG TPA: hypothetical protein VKW06_16005 [Candidatus Angelobacter sp.]|nr:hypothetical protein [Candidatus Angelobacter sp.]
MSFALRLAVFCSLLIVSPSSLPQNSNAAPRQDNLYAAALYASIAQMDKEWSRVDKTPEDSIPTDYRHMIVKKSEMAEKLPDRAGDYQIEVLDPRELVERYRKLRKGFAILVFHPMKNEGTALTVNIKVFWYSHKRTASSYIFSGSTDVEFRYDCEKRDWVISKVQLSGV